LHNKALAAKQAGAEFLAKGDVNADTLGRTQKRVFLADDFTAQFGQIEGAAVRVSRYSRGLASPGWNRA
jgi:hypothetical protein